MIINSNGFVKFKNCLKINKSNHFTSSQTLPRSDSVQKYNRLLCVFSRRLHQRQEPKGRLLRLHAELPVRCCSAIPRGWQAKITAGQRAPVAAQQHLLLRVNLPVSAATSEIPEDAEVALVSRLAEPRGRIDVRASSSAVHRPEDPLLLSELPHAAQTIQERARGPEPRADSVPQATASAAQKEQGHHRCRANNHERLKCGLFQDYVYLFN